MEKSKWNIAFFVIIVLNFYAVPLLIIDTGSAMTIMLRIIPAICFVTSVLYGIKNGFHLSFPLFVAIVFIPSIFIFHNSSAWVYTIGYGVISLLGTLLSLIVQKCLKK